ncbi:transposase [Marinobacter halodurans]|uniref:Transposase n=1 Tax=Marinobacter halodurans TaxID=2528979 RepID=A0ABY1ZLC7_9GAMM|nr:transposase [Marinobacter halodurans]TBW56640.1 transposase [Marinobacter halodurans]
MSYKNATAHRHSIAGQEYLVTACTQNRYPAFQDFNTARAAVAALRKTEENGLAKVMAWVIMPDHLHLLLALTGVGSLGDVLAHLKIQASRNAGSKIPWQKGYHERTLRRIEDRQDIARYIILNPVRAGIVRTVREYPHWDSMYLG